MAADRWRRVRRWARRRRKALLIGGVALLLVAIAAYLIYDAATEDVVGEDSSAADPFAAPSGTPSLPPPGTDLGSLDPATFGLPTGGFSVGCDVTTFTMSFTSDAPIAIAGYLTSAGESDYFPNESTGSVSVQQCPTDPSVLIIVQGGPTATRLTCTATKSGRVTETQSAGGPNSLVACYG